MKINKIFVIVLISVILLIAVSLLYFALLKKPSTVEDELTSAEEKIILTEGQREGPLLVQKIYTDRVTGLNFPAYPIPRDEGLPLTLRIGEIASNGCTITLKLIKIEGDTSTFLKKIQQNRICPICLSGNTLIDTPKGPINIKELRKGMTVWTADAYGTKHVAMILEIVRTQVPKGFKIFHIVLDDGRELFASSGHPTADGRTIGDISAGDILDGAKVISSKLIHYEETYTYDILPYGETGLYWANSISIKSTLNKIKTQK